MNDLLGNLPKLETQKSRLGLYLATLLASIASISTGSTQLTPKQTAQLSTVNPNNIGLVTTNTEENPKTPPEKGSGRRKFNGRTS